MGNVISVGQEFRGWFLGDFINSPNHANTSDVYKLELKLSIHEPTYSFGFTCPRLLDFGCCSMVVLLSGDCEYKFLRGDGSKRTAFLCAVGDYVFWRPNISHAVISRKGCTIMTIRWYRSKDAFSDQMASGVRE